MVAENTFSSKILFKTVWHPSGKLKFVFSKKATKFDKIFAVDFTLTTYCQIDGEDFVNFCGLLRKHELYVVVSIKSLTPCY